MQKREIALRQLKAAAKHYQQREYVCSITLSGAAEEILGQLVKKRTGTNQLDSEVNYLRSIYQYFTKKIPTNRELIWEINKVKNELKHNDIGENKWVEADFEQEAASLFVRAMKNYFDCYQEFPSDEIAVNLFVAITN